ncbi:MAG: PRC-barrel domain-containing protein [Candidatus Nomurabacteria bacterium]|jgi:uncharacterized protein YrrD|nr:PRC-barrel domain-containing protein [Candidatus Nomurabacteria bacterium]
MLLLGSKLVGTNVLSLQTGRPIGVTAQPIINPANLKIIAYYVESPLVKQKSENILRVDEVREFSSMGMIIDSIDDLVAEEDVIKIKQLLQLNFSLIGHKVVTKKGKKIGKVTDYSLDSGSFAIQQLIVSKPLISSFNIPEVTVHRSQIVEINNEKIIIKDDKAPVKERASATAAAQNVANFVNPFRKEEALEPTEAKAK